MSDNQSIDLQLVKEVAAQERQLSQTLGVMDNEQRRRHEHTANVLDTLIPAPNHPTMGEIEWDRKSHERAEAIAHWSNADPSPVIMLGKEGKKIAVYQDSPWFQGMRILNPNILTPTGRKFKLVPEDDAKGPRNPETPPAETPNNASSDTPRTPEPQVGEAWEIEIEPGDIRNALLEKNEDGELTWFTANGDGFYYSCRALHRLAPVVKAQ